MGKVREVTEEQSGGLTGAKGITFIRRPAARSTARLKVAKRRIPRSGLTREIVLSPLARLVLEERYLRKDENGRVIETPEEMFLRVARHVAQAENSSDASEWEGRFFTTMASLEFLPNSPCLMNAGSELGQLGACFVLPVKDSLDEIFTTLKHAALVNKSGGGTGFSFSRLRPKDDVVASTGGVASGPVSFMRVFDAATAEIKQGGRRRGANMGILRVDHPDILDFVRAKSKPGVLEQFNISVGLTDEFMQKAATGDEYETINPRTGKPGGRLCARDVWTQIAEQAWKTGEPGIIFIDRVNQTNPTPCLGEIEATNPCGEQPLLPYESCILGSVNLSAMVSNQQIDWKRLGETVSVAVRFLDDVIDVNRYPLLQIERMSKGNRKIGLGIMGLAHMLAKLGIPYDSQNAIETAEKVMRFISEHALQESRQLAKERGSFPNFKKSVYAERGEPRLRNATRTTVAPTGTISIIANTSSGIEPIFSVAYKRKALDHEFLVFDPVFKGMAESGGVFSDQLGEEIAANGSLVGIKGVPDDLKALFKTAYEIPPEQHVRMQAAVQRYTDNAVSKTVNLPRTAKVEDVERVFRLAHSLGCEGITVFRQGSRAAVLSSGERDRQYVTMRERPKLTSGFTEKFESGCGSLYIHVSQDKDGLLEVFSNLGRGGGCPAQSEATARLVSLCLRCNVDPQEIVRQLEGMRCPTASRRRAEGKPVDVLSCPDAIAQAILRTMNRGGGKVPVTESSEVCPRCGGPREPGRCGVCLACWEGGCDGS